MNSLYKSYIRNSLLLLGGVALFSAFFFLIDIMGGRQTEDWDVLGSWHNYVIMVCLAATVLHTFLHYKNLNRKTGIFIKQLPIKYSKDFVFRIVDSVLFILASLAVMFIIALAMYGPYFHLNPGLKVMSQMFSTLYLTFTMAVLLFSFSLLCQQFIGMPVLAALMPFIIVFAVFGAFIGYDSMPYAIREFWVLRIILDTLNTLFEAMCFFGNIQPEETVFLIWSIPLIILAFVLHSKIDYSNTGKLFLFRWCRPLAYVTGSTLFAFFMQFIINAFGPRNVVFVAVGFILCWIAGFKIIQYFVRRFD